jgi:hypothetical protein
MASKGESVFKWDTMLEVGPYELKYTERTVPGRTFEVVIGSGEKVRVWRADDGQEYFCHGLTFGGKEAPGGVASPLSDHIPTILRGHFNAIPEIQARAGDILIWRGASMDDIVHSAILNNPKRVPGQDALDYAAMLQTKNGIMPETIMSLGQLIENYYGESYKVYRKR